MYTLLILAGLTTSPKLVNAGEFLFESSCLQAASEWKKQAVKAVCHNYDSEKNTKIVLRKN
jgi:hypothetical protein